MAFCQEKTEIVIHQCHHLESSNKIKASQASSKYYVRIIAYTVKKTIITQLLDVLG